MLFFGSFDNYIALNLGPSSIWNQYGYRCGREKACNSGMVCVAHIGRIRPLLWMECDADQCMLGPERQRVVHYTVIRFDFPRVWWVGGFMEGHRCRQYYETTTLSTSRQQNNLKVSWSVSPSPSLFSFVEAHNTIQGKLFIHYEVIFCVYQ